jgi:hypothetical protein
MENQAGPGNRQARPPVNVRPSVSVSGMRGRLAANHAMPGLGRDTERTTGFILCNFGAEIFQRRAVGGNDHIVVAATCGPSWACMAQLAY